jgi:predicted amidohydrolase
MTEPSSDVRVACVQFAPTVGARDQNVADSLAILASGVANGATILVLPELASSGYVFESREEAFELSEEVPGGPACAAWTDFAQANGVHVVGGLPERSGSELYDTAVLCGPDGLVGKYRKLHLWGDENLYFEAGQARPPVFPTVVGRIGLAICYDAWFPEVFRVMASGKADLVCMPFNNAGALREGISTTEMGAVLCRAAAHVNGLCIAIANRVGSERGVTFVGQSSLISYSGAVFAGPGSAEAPDVVIGDISVTATRRGLVSNGFNNYYKDRRTDVYGDAAGRLGRS